MNSFIDDVMGFEPTNLDAFQEKPQSKGNANIYRTNPANSKAEDGHYHSKVRIIYNPFNLKRSIVHQAAYVIKDTQGILIVKSMLGDGNKDCPLFKSWKALHYAKTQGEDGKLVEDVKKKEWGDQMYEKNETDWVLVQILEDNNQPELVGQIKAMKLPKVVLTKLTAKMNPSADSKKAPVAVMDYLIGLPLEMDVTPGPDDPKNPQRKQREISYDLCDFDTDYAPIIRVDGTPLFTDEELEQIDAFNEVKSKINKAKTDKAKADAQKELADMTSVVKAIYQKALDYLKGEAHTLNLEDECGYTPWSPEVSTRVANWIKLVADMKDPQVENINETAAPAAAEVVTETADPAADPAAQMATGDLPF
jgi:hypothetical protein